MYLYDIYTFFTETYTKKSSESIIMWLSNYDYYDRVLFVNFFILNRFRLLWRYYGHFNDNHQNLHVPNCNCQLIFEKTLKDIMCEKTSKVWFLKKCTGITAADPSDETVKTFNFGTEKSFSLDSKTINFNESAAQGSNYDKFFEIDTTDFALKTINVEDTSVSIRIFDKFQKEFMKLDKIAHLIDVRELFVLMYPHMPGLHIFDMILPEYMRLAGLRNRFRYVKADAETVLMNVYNFFTRNNIQQVNSKMKMTSILPRISYIKNPIVDVADEYFYQPRLAGIRIFICKTTQNNIIVLNKNHMKITLNCAAIQNLKYDLVNTYSGEFIIVLENVETEQFVPKKYLLKYLSNVMSNKNMYKVRLVLLDIHSWQNTNLLVKSYKDRYALFDNFIDYVNHGKSIVKIKNYSNISTIYDHFNEYLNSTALESMLNGVVYRKKDCVYETVLNAINFNNQFQKHIVVCRYSAFQRMLHAKHPQEVIAMNEPFCILSPKNSDLTLCCVCYYVDGTLIKLALFDKNRFRPLCHIVTEQTNNHYKVLMKHCSPVKINGETYPWIIVKIGLYKDDKGTALTNLEFCPEKTLFDISPWFSGM